MFLTNNDLKGGRPHPPLSKYPSLTVMCVSSPDVAVSAVRSMYVYIYVHKNSIHHAEHFSQLMCTLSYIVCVCRYKACSTY